MKALVSVNADGRYSQMTLRFPESTLRFSIAPVIKNIKRIISYHKGFFLFEYEDGLEDGRVDLKEICSWMGLKIDFENIDLEVVK